MCMHTNTTHIKHTRYEHPKTCTDIVRKLSVNLGWFFLELFLFFGYVFERDRDSATLTPCPSRQQKLLVWNIYTLAWLKHTKQVWLCCLLFASCKFRLSFSKIWHCLTCFPQHPHEEGSNTYQGIEGPDWRNPHCVVMMLSLDRRPRGLVAHACHTLVRISGAVRWWGLHLQNFLKQSGSDELHFNFQILNRYQMTQISLVARFNTISEKEASIEQCRKDSLQIHSWFSAVCLKRVKYDKFWNFYVFGFLGLPLPPSCASRMAAQFYGGVACCVCVRACECVRACMRSKTVTWVHDSSHTILLY